MFACIVEALFCLPELPSQKEGFPKLAIGIRQALFVTDCSMEIKGLFEVVNGCLKLVG